MKKLIFLGLDGLDPELTERWMAEGKMPNLAQLKQQGSYRRLRTTCPPLSPVAWSTFATGVNPGQAQHFRFSQSRSAHLCAGTFFGKGAPRAPRLANREIRNSARTSVGRDAPQKRAILETPRPQRRGKHHTPCAGDIPPRRFQRPPALRHVDAGSARLARHVLLIHLSRRRIRGPGKRAADSICKLKVRKRLANPAADGTSKFKASRSSTHLIPANTRRGSV